MGIISGSGRAYKNSYETSLINGSSYSQEVKNSKNGGIFNKVKNIWNRIVLQKEGADSIKPLPFIDEKLKLSLEKSEKKRKIYSSKLEKLLDMGIECLSSITEENVKTLAGNFRESPNRQIADQDFLQFIKKDCDECLLSFKDDSINRNKRLSYLMKRTFAHISPDEIRNSPRFQEKFQIFFTHFLEKTMSASFPQEQRATFRSLCIGAPFLTNCFSPETERSCSEYNEKLYIAQIEKALPPFDKNLSRCVELMEEKAKRGRPTSELVKNISVEELSKLFLQEEIHADTISHLDNEVISEAVENAIDKLHGIEDRLRQNFNSPKKYIQESHEIQKNMQQFVGCLLDNKEYEDCNSLYSNSPSIRRSLNPTSLENCKILDIFNSSIKAFSI
ncbi:MAG: hypothetical protein QRY74_06250 [Chlamydia sp.]